MLDKKREEGSIKVPFLLILRFYGSLVFSLLVRREKSGRKFQSKKRGPRYAFILAFLCSNEIYW
jgi:hypothetical protein